MQYVEQTPPDELAEFIECIWVVKDASRRARTPERVVPDGCPEWIVHVGDAFSRSIDGHWRKQSKSFLAGTLSRPWLLRGGARIRTLGIRFKPGALAALFSIDLSGTADREIDLGHSLLQAEARQLVVAVRRAKSSSAMIAAAATHLSSMLSGRRPRALKTRKAIERIRTLRGRCRVESLAKSIGVTRRTLERAFRRELGISPKQYARIVRFNAALATLKGPDRLRLVDVAVDGGYFDEAHLSREFRSLSGSRASSGEVEGGLTRHFTRIDRLQRLLSGP